MTQVQDTTLKDKVIKITLIISLISVLLVLLFFFRHALQNYLLTVVTYLKTVRQTHPLLSAFIYMTVYSSIAAAALPGAAFLTLAGGFLFGCLPGALYTIISATAGALLLFLLIRYGTTHTYYINYIKHLRQHIDQSLFQKFTQEFTKHGAYYLISARLIPIIPFFLVNSIAALIPVSWQLFTITTFIGIIPGTILYSCLGSSISSLTSLIENTSKYTLSPIWLLILLFLGISIAAIPYFITHKKIMGFFIALKKPLRNKNKKQFS